MFDVKDFGAVLDGVTDDSAAIQKALDAAGAVKDAGDQIVLISGGAAISSPLTVHPFTTLQGVHNNRTHEFSSKAVLRALPAFSGSAMIKFVDQVAGGYAQQSYGQHVYNITLDGSAAKYRNKDNLFSGIRSEGLVRGVVMRDVSIFNVTDRGVQTFAQNKGTAYSWHCDNIQVGQAGLDGFRLSGMSDSTWINCRAIGSGRWGWYIGGSSNSTWHNCRSEWSGKDGWNLCNESWGSGTGSGGAIFSNCSTDRNNYNGWVINMAGNSPALFSNIMCRRDGRNNNLGGSGYAGVRINDSTMPLSFDNLYVYPGLSDDGLGTTSPDYGIRVQNSLWVRVNSGYIHAKTKTHQDLGGNTSFQIDPRVGLATGPTDAPVRI